jgi:lycopene beta-cyclase
MESFDYVFSGGGCAALSLVRQIIKQPNLSGKKILILEKEPKAKNDRTWCFWERGEGPFEHLVEKSWNRAWFHGAGLSRLLNLEPYSYKMIRADRFYRDVKAELSRTPSVRILETEVQDFTESKEGIRVRTTSGDFEGSFLFNSLVPPLVKDPGHHYLYQHFKGWFIKTTEPSFKPDEAVLMDFRIPQNGECRFMYILPLSETEALVEFTVFSEALLPDAEYDAALREYLQDEAGIRDFTIQHSEFGSIPMFSAPFQEKIGKRIINIGTAGGRTKASTGYTFTRIQRHSLALAQALSATGKPDLPLAFNRSRFAFYDKVLLHVLANKNVPADRIFRNLFRYNKPSSVFRFLDEDTHFLQEYRLLNTVPVFKFIGPGWKELLKM